ncbi:MAG: hypothetical protein FWE67_04205 [Planctomycetaceae bacterium]|nr:hypothetical protein [Planctomycetaceae bacterium]
MNTVENYNLFQTFSFLPETAKTEIADLIILRSAQAAEMKQDKLLELLLNAPVATEEEIQLQDNVRGHLRQWKINGF